MQWFCQQLTYGIQLGSLYALIALGYTMVYGVLKLINFAHGDVYMVGAYVGFYACTSWLPFRDLSVHPEAATTNVLLAVVALMLSMVVCAGLGVIIERFAYRPLRNGLTTADAHFWGLIAAIPIALRFGALYSGIGLSVWVVAGILIGFAFRPVFRWLRARIHLSPSRLNALITAIGVSFVLENGGILVFGANPNFVPNIVPEKNIMLPGGVNVGTGQLAILLVSLALMAGLWHVVMRTRKGCAMRATSQDVEAAQLMGVNTDHVIAYTFAVGAALAGAGGFMVAALTHVKITALFGLQPGIKAFVAAVLGGIGNIPGAVLGGLLMGIAEAFVSGFQATSTYRDAIAFLLLIVILLARPSGILGRNLPEKV